MKCPICDAATVVKDTRQKPGSGTYRRHECERKHRFNTRETPTQTPQKTAKQVVQRINLSDAVDDLAPAPPPCFKNRMDWTEYLKSCAASQNDGESQKVIFVKNGNPLFNYDFNICADCSPVYSLAMTQAGRCHPNALKAQAPKECTA